MALILPHHAPRPPSPQPWAIFLAQNASVPKRPNHPCSPQSRTSASVAGRLSAPVAKGDKEPLTKLVIVKQLPANHDFRDQQECFMDVAALFISHAQASILVKPANRAFHRPAVFTQSPAVR